MEAARRKIRAGDIAEQRITQEEENKHGKGENDEDMQPLDHNPGPTDQIAPSFSLSETAQRLTTATTTTAPIATTAAAAAAAEAAMTAARVDTTPAVTPPSLPATISTLMGAWKAENVVDNDHGDGNRDVDGDTSLLSQQLQPCSLTPASASAPSCSASVSGSPILSPSQQQPLLLPPVAAPPPAPGLDTRRCELVKFSCGSKQKSLVVSRRKEHSGKEGESGEDTLNPPDLLEREGGEMGTGGAAAAASVMGETGEVDGHAIVTEAVSPSVAFLVSDTGVEVTPSTVTKMPNPENKGARFVAAMAAGYPGISDTSGRGGSRGIPPVLGDSSKTRSIAGASAAASAAATAEKGDVTTVLQQEQNSDRNIKGNLEDEANRPKVEADGRSSGRSRSRAGGGGIHSAAACDLGSGWQAVREADEGADSSGGVTAKVEGEVKAKAEAEEVPETNGLGGIVGLEFPWRPVHVPPATKTHGTVVSVLGKLTPPMQSTATPAAASGAVDAAAAAIGDLGRRIGQVTAHCGQHNQRSPDAQTGGSPMLLKTGRAPRSTRLPCLGSTPIRRVASF